MKQDYPDGVDEDGELQTRALADSAMRGDDYNAFATALTENVTAEDQLLNVDMGIIPLYHGSAVAIYSDDVLDNVVIGASGKPLLQYAIHK